MDGNSIDLRDAIWELANNLGHHSIFVGDSYPIVRRMPPSMHGTEGLPFMKHGGVFSMHCQLNMLGHAIPDLCCFSFDGTSSWGVRLSSSDSYSRWPPLWMVPSMRNCWDWNNEVQHVM